MSNKFVVNKLNPLGRVHHLAEKGKNEHEVTGVILNPEEKKDEKRAILERMKSIQKGHKK